jgi:23S rRNA pseudouridine2605 synthase
VRLNKYIALSTGMSRRAADDAIAKGQVLINNIPAELGQQVEPEKDAVTLDGRAITPAVNITIILNKPTDYVCSRDGQGSKTVYDLLPEKYHNLKPVGRLDKDSSGLLLLTNDGTLAYELTHPSFQKTKVYEIETNKSLASADEIKIKEGVVLDDGVSKLDVRRLTIDDRNETPNVQRLSSNVYRVAMAEGRNRQIRRTFGALGYTVKKLHRTHFGPYELSELTSGNYKEL